MRRPTESEFGPYHTRYISLVPETDIVSALDLQATLIERWPARVPADRETAVYAEGKWTPRQVVSHLSDTERIFSYRALRFSRRDETPLPGFEQDPYVQFSPCADVPFQLLVAEFAALRRASLPMFQRMDEAAWSAVGTASDVRVSVRALAYMMVGHVRYHATLFKERYGLMLEA